MGYNRRKYGNTMSELKTAILDWNDPNSPVSTQYGDIYFSVDGGAAESEYVFLQQNNLAERFKQLPDSPATLFNIIETGFGTGLNFTLCLKLWRKYAPKKARLRFISIEKHPLTLRDLQKAYQKWPDIYQEAEMWQRSYPPLFPGLYNCCVDHNIELVLFFGDVLDGLDELLETLHPSHHHRDGWVDAWFLDGFAPSKNPDMWSADLFQRMAHLSQTSTTFATFTAAGSVRRGLTEAGFVVKKIKGHGKKREMLVGHFNEKTVTASLAKPPRGHRATWYLSPKNTTLPHSVAIIGAGIAGANIAHALAKRGVKVKVFDTNNGPAMAASGNPQGIIYCKVSYQDSAASRFICNALNYAQNFYRSMFERGELIASKDGELCGVLMLDNEKNRQAIIHTFHDSPHFVEDVPKNQTFERFGVEACEGGLLLKNAGWLNPVRVCQALLEHPNIECTFNSNISNLQKIENGWLLNDTQVDAVVLATGSELNPLSDFLPIKSIRGQVTNIKSYAPLNQLKTVVCGRGYIAPSQNGMHCIGASFNLKDNSPLLTRKDQDDNIENLMWAFPGLDKSTLCTDHLDGRVAFRSTTPDYLPIAGPLPDIKELVKHFSPLSKNANKNIYRASSNVEGLYIFTGLGSKGLAYAPICADHLAALITGEPSSLPLTQHISLHPRRFLVRNIIKNIPQSFDEE